MTKNYQLSLARLTGILFLFVFPAIQAQNETVVPPATVGTIVRYTPDSLVINPVDSPRPVIYTYTKATSYTDKDGNPVAMDLIQAGALVTVFYETEGDKPTARRVVVEKSPAAASPATGITAVGVSVTSEPDLKPKITPPDAGGTASAPVSSPSPQPTAEAGSVKGSVTWVTPDEIQVKTVSATNPVKVAYGPATTYSDDKGNPVGRDAITSGQQVVVSYVRQGDANMATSVVVRQEIGSNEDLSMRKTSPSNSSNSTKAARSGNPNTSRNSDISDPTRIDR